MSWLTTTQSRIGTRKNDEYRLDVDDAACSTSLSMIIRHLVTPLLPGRDSIVLVCIGTDRSTGDSLGPLTGTKLQEADIKNIHVYGTLESPVHATNLQERLAEIQRRHARPLIIAIDACLGKVDSIGNILIGMGPLKPGAGVNKDLPPVGDLHVTGIVNVGGFMDYFVLQNTRLYLIMRLASAIADGLAQGLSNIMATPCSGAAVK